MSSIGTGLALDGAIITPHVEQALQRMKKQINQLSHGMNQSMNQNTVLSAFTNQLNIMVLLFPSIGQPYAPMARCRQFLIIGLQGKDVVVFAVEKLITSKLYEPFTNKRTFNIDEHIGMAVSGLISDARRIVETARLEAANYRAQYGIGIPLKYLNDRLSMYMHAYTLYSAVRPYGCSIILSSYQDNPEMYVIDPSGVSYGFYGCAIGKAKQSAKTEIEKLKLASMDSKDIVKEAARIIYLVHDELKDKQFELEMSWVGKHTDGKHERVPSEIQLEAEARACQSLAEDSDSDTEEM